MAYDIGPRIGIDGEREFRQQLRTVSESIKTLGSEMKVVTTAFAGNEDSMEALTAKNEVLSKTIAALNDKISQQRRFLDASKEEFGDNAEETHKWQRAINESEAQLNSLQNELRQNERRLESFGEEADDAGDAMEEAADSALNFGDALKASFVGNLAAEGAKALFSALVELGGAMINLDEETAEFRQQQSMLNAAFKDNGFEADTARTAYSGLFRVIGDSDEATEASQLLANLATSTEDVETWVKLAAGSWGKFGKAVPITSMIEAANEAAKTGKSVSALDDIISWSGGDAEEFGKQLEAASTEAERMALITETLSAQLGTSADAFYENNEELMRTRERQLLLNETMAELGEAVGKIKNDLGEDFAPILHEAGSAFADMLTSTEGAEERFTTAVGNLIEKGGESMAGFIQVGGKAFSNILTGLTSGENQGKLGEAVVNVIGAISDTLSENAGEIAVAAVVLLAELGIALLKSVSEVLDDVPAIIEDIKQAFLANKEVFADLGRELGQAFIDALLSMFNLVEKLFEPYEKYGINWGPGPAIKPSRQATGLNYVPYDGFLASLHEGEMILTRKQAEMIRANGVNNTSLQNAAAAMVNGIQAFSGAGGETPVNITLVTPDGDTLATYILPSLVRIADAAGTPIIST